MHKLFSLVISVALVAVLSVSYSFLRQTKMPSRADKAFERVMSAGELRCGYVLFEPAVYIDQKTGEKKGFMVDLVKDLTERLGLKLVWAEEVTFGGMFAGLETGRYDAICSGTWISAGRSRVAEFTMPFLYSYIGVVARADDDRFDDNLQAANNNSIKIAVIDGDISEEIAKRDYPKAQIVATPQLADGQQVYVDVISKKADITFDEWTKIQLFSQHNPGKLKTVKTKEPVRVFPWAIAVGKGEHSLGSLLSGGLTELLYSGEIDRIVKRNQPIEKSYYYFKAPIALD